MRKGRYNFIGSAANAINADLSFSANPAKAKAAQPTILDFKVVNVTQPNKPVQKVLVQVSPGTTTEQVKTAVQEQIRTSQENQSVMSSQQGRSGATQVAPQAAQQIQVSVTPATAQDVAQAQQGRSGAVKLEQDFVVEPAPGRSGVLNTVPTFAPVTYADMEQPNNVKAGSFAFTMPTTLVEWFGTIFVKGSFYYSACIGVHGTTVGTLVFTALVAAMVINIYKLKIKSLIKIR